MKNENTKVKTFTLERGDATTVAEATGYSPIYVRMVAQGARKNQTIINALEDLFASREELMKKYQAHKEQLAS